MCPLSVAIHKTAVAVVVDVPQLQAVRAQAGPPFSLGQVGLAVRTQAVMEQTERFPAAVAAGQSMAEHPGLALPGV
jgi:hypothetical protein